jgi:hypothetical protein
MEGRQRRSFTDDYKRQAVDLVASSGRSHLASSTSKQPLPSVSFSILPSVQPRTSRAALIFSASAGVTGVSASAKVLPANAAAKSPVVLRMIECHTWLKSAFGRMAALRPKGDL